MGSPKGSLSWEMEEKSAGVASDGLTEAGSTGLWFAQGSARHSGSVVGRTESQRRAVEALGSCPQQLLAAALA